MSTRRQFLAVSSAALAASAWPGALFAQFPGAEVFSNGNLGAYSQGLLTLATFERLVGSEFRVFLQDGSVGYLTLLSVTDRSPSTAAVKQGAALPLLGSAIGRGRIVGSPVAASTSSAFDLQFSVGGPALDQQSYTMDHGTLGRFAAFVVPGLSPTGGNTCGISFNYLSGATIVPGPARLQVPLHLPETASPVALPGTSGQGSGSVAGRSALFD